MSSRTQHIEQLLESFQALKRKLGSKSAKVVGKSFSNITPAQWGVLRILSHKESVSTKDIATCLEISSSAATQLVDGLVENGYLKRKNNPTDRRSQYIEFSPKAKKQMHLWKKNHLKVWSEVFSALNEKELEQYLRLSMKVAHHSPSSHA